jgi:hypothetical protein
MMDATTIAAPDALSRAELGLSTEAVIYWCCPSLDAFADSAVGLGRDAARRRRG